MSSIKNHKISEELKNKRTGKVVTNDPGFKYRGINVFKYLSIRRNWEVVSTINSPEDLNRFIMRVYLSILVPRSSKELQNNNEKIYDQEVFKLNPDLSSMTVLDNNGRPLEVYNVHSGKYIDTDLKTFTKLLSRFNTILFVFSKDLSVSTESYRYDLKTRRCLTRNSWILFTKNKKEFDKLYRYYSSSPKNTIEVKEIHRS